MFRDENDVEKQLRCRTKDALGTACRQNMSDASWELKIGVREMKIVD